MSADQLPCGASVDDLVDQVADGAADRRTEHQQHCRHCQAALAEYARLWAPIQNLAAEPVHVPASVLDEVLRRIHATATQPWHGVIPGPRGATRVSDRVVAVTARLSAEQVPGVRAVLTRRADPADGVIVGLAGVSTALHVTLAATYGEDLHQLADRIRAAITRSVRAHTGLDPVDVTIVIDDVPEP